MSMRLLVSGASKTVCRLAAELKDGLGLMVTPNQRNSAKLIAAQGLPWAIDNGAFKHFDAQRFRALVNRSIGLPGLLWVVAPDVVGDARLTLDRFDEWAPQLTQVPLALAAQDGLEDLTVPWDRMACLFIGGSTRFKLSRAAAELSLEAKRRGKLSHMGRVNSLRRMKTAQLMGCDTVDGSSASMFPDRYLRLYVGWIRRLNRQPLLFASKRSGP